MSSRVCPAAIAKQRLAEKEADVTEQLEFVTGLVRRLKTDKSILVASFENQYDNLHDQFAVVHDALIFKEQKLLHQLKNDLRFISTANDELTSSAENLVKKSRHVRYFYLRLAECLYHVRSTYKTIYNTQGSPQKILSE